MIFVYNRSTVPFTPWGAVRHGGANNLAGDIKGKYLVLMNVDILNREGAWHYIFQFDVRDSLETNALAQLVGRDSSYPDDMDWHQWLGDGYHIITAAVREEILNMPQADARTGAVITDMRAIPAGRPIPGRSADDMPFEVDIPNELVLSLPIN